jgi:ABC-type transport system involved in cytochrome bd biosynthesis fused ATPase/permease subunit
MLYSAVAYTLTAVCDTFFTVLNVPFDVFLYEISILLHYILLPFSFAYVKRKMKCHLRAYMKKRYSSITNWFQLSHFTHIYFIKKNQLDYVYIYYIILLYYYS